MADFAFSPQFVPTGSQTWHTVGRDLTVKKLKNVISYSSDSQLPYGDGLTFL